MINTQITAGAERKLKNHTSFRMTISNSLTMAYRGLLEIRRKPEQLSDVTLQPILFTLMFTYIFGGAIAGNVHNYLPIVIPGYFGHDGDNSVYGYRRPTPRGYGQGSVQSF